MTPLSFLEGSKLPCAGFCNVHVLCVFGIKGFHKREKYNNLSTFASLLYLLKGLLMWDLQDDYGMIKGEGF